MLLKGFPSFIRKWIMSMLHSRVIVYNDNDIYVSVKPTKGSPQGGILSLLLWNLVVDVPIASINNRRIAHAQAYADDLSIYKAGRDMDTIRNMMQSALRILENWGNENLLRFEVRKCEIIVFKKGRHMPTNKPITIYNQPIRQVSKVTYLGITLDSRLTWIDHCLDKAKKAIMILTCTKRCVGYRWGLTPKILLFLYNMVVKPALAYGCLVWHTGLRFGKAHNALSRVQRIALLGVTGALPSTPTSALQALVGIPGIKEFLNAEAGKATTRLFAYNHWRRHCSISGGGQDSHWRAGELLIAKLMLFRPLDFPVDNHMEVSRFKVIMDPTYDPFPSHTKPNKVLCFTDGSGLRDHYGAGIFITGITPTSIELSTHLGTLCTVFQAEISAILETAGFLLQEKLENQSIHIYTNSRASLYALNGTSPKSKLALDCIRFLNLLADKNEVTISWVKAHNGNYRNDKADQLAKIGSELQHIGTSPIIPIPKSQIFRIIHEEMTTAHLRHWNALSTCYHTKSLILNDDLTWIPKLLLNLPRFLLQQLIQVFTGHINLAERAHRIGCRLSPTCPLCGEEKETIWHFITICPPLTPLRLKHFSFIPTDLRDFITKPRIKELTHFLQDSKRLISYDL